MKIGAKWVGTSNEEGDRPKATVEGIWGTRPPPGTAAPTRRAAPPHEMGV